MTLDDFVKKNVAVIAKDRARSGSKHTDKQFVNFIEQKNGVAYHNITIGDDYGARQGTLLIKTKEADALGLQTIIIVKGKNPEAVRNRMDMIKKVVGVTSPVSFFQRYFFIEHVYANENGDGGAGGSSGSADGGDSSGSPGLTDSSGNAVTDSSGNAVGTGCGSCGGFGGPDGSGATGSGTGPSLCLAGIPVVNGGGNQTISGSSATLTGTFSGYASVWMYTTPPNTGWSEVSGPNTTTFSGAYLTPTGTYTGTIGAVASGLVPGTYVFRLILSSAVEVGCGATSDVTVTVTTPPTGSINAAPTSCKIATDQSTCPVNLSWSTLNPVGTSAVTRDGRAGNLYVGNTSPVGGQAANVPYDVDGNVIYRLYNNATELGMVNVGVSCVSGGWDSAGNVCANPVVQSAIPTGEWYSPGTIDITCLNSNLYKVVRDPSGANVTSGPSSYSGVIHFPVSISANYSVTCLHGTYASVPVIVYYHAGPPPTATISLTALPRTISKDDQSTLHWNVQYPTNACSLIAKAVCTNSICTAAQTKGEADLNARLATEKTDTTDPNTSRSIATAVTKVAPGHINTDWRAYGTKTLAVGNTTDFVYDCGSGNKVTARVLVTKGEEK
jgi:hypothetical protein